MYAQWKYYNWNKKQQIEKSISPNIPKEIVVELNEIKWDDVYMEMLSQL